MMMKNQILKKMKVKGIEVGSRVPDKNMRVNRFTSLSILVAAFQNLEKNTKFIIKYLTI